jgi:hypothetical protein
LEYLGYLFEKNVTLEKRWKDPSAGAAVSAVKAYLHLRYETMKF